MRRACRWGPRRGQEFWEMGLFIFFLAIAGGASIFFFFISSRDMRAAQAQAVWIQSVDGVLDLVVRELEHAVVVEHPFAGPATECFFRRGMVSGPLPPSLEEEGFLFADNGLQHVVRNASGSALPRPFNTLGNPLITGVQGGQFERLEADLFRISFKMPSPLAPENVRTFNRLVFLRNQ